MTIHMKNLERLSLAEMQELVQGSRKLTLSLEGQAAIYGFIEALLKAQQTSRSPGRRAGSWPSRSRSSSRFQTFWKPSKTSTDPVARKMKSEAAMVTRVLRKRAGAI